MRSLPDPDTAAMGRLVDRWLVSLRQRGCNDRLLERYARRLARASEYTWEGHTPGERAAIAAFFAWLEGALWESE